MDEILVEFGRKVLARMPGSRLLDLNSAQSSPEGLLLVDVLSVTDQERFFDLVLDFQDEYLTPLGIHNIVFIPHSVSESEAYYPDVLTATTVYPAS